MTALKWLLIVVLTGYACGLSRCFSRNAFCFGSDNRGTAPRRTPEAQGMLTTADGGIIDCPGQASHPVILYFHGNSDFLASFWRFRHLPTDRGRRGCPIVAMRISGQPVSTVVADAAAYALQSYRRRKIVVWGRQRGIAVALAASRSGS
jgi:hypothetical protein